MKTFENLCEEVKDRFSDDDRWFLGKSENYIAFISSDHHSGTWYTIILPISRMNDFLKQAALEETKLRLSIKQTDPTDIEEEYDWRGNTTFVVESAMKSLGGEKIGKDRYGADPR